MNLGRVNMRNIYTGASNNCIIIIQFHSFNGFSLSKLYFFIL